MTTAPRCSACNRFAIVEIEDGFFLCARCETLLKREFPAAAKRARPVASTETASPKTTAPPDGASTSASERIAAFPSIPDFLDRRVA